MISIEGGTGMVTTDKLTETVETIKKGGLEKYHQKNAEKGKLFVRERLELLFDEGVEIEDAFFANCASVGLPADGVVTGIGKINGQRVCVMANDSTVKAGSWEQGPSEKIIRIQETAEKLQLPLLYLVDSAGARIDGSSRNVSGPPRSWPHLLQPSEAIRKSPANLSIVRSVRRRRGIYSSFL